MSTPPSKQSSTPKPPPPTYISSSGQTLSSLPLTARLNRMADNAYNFIGLYLVSLLSLDPYAAAQNSRFNTRGPGRTAQQATGSGSAGARAGGGTGAGIGGSTGWFGGSGPRGGGSGGPGRRMGTVNDVRAPECGSCG